MRKTFFLLALGVIFYSCNNDKTASATADSSVKKEEPSATGDNLTMPYTAMYSSQFTIGDQKYAQMVLNLFKQWDDNNMKDGMSNFADSVNFYTNNWTFHGSRDALYTASQQQRDMYPEVKTVVSAYTPVHSVDKNEDWVLIWSTGYTKDKKGVSDSLNYQDTWRINKDGKVDMVYQYTSHEPKADKK